MDQLTRPTYALLYTLTSLSSGIEALHLPLLPTFPLRVS